MQTRTARLAYAQAKVEIALVLLQLPAHAKLTLGLRLCLLGRPARWRRRPQLRAPPADLLSANHSTMSMLADLPRRSKTLIALMRLDLWAWLCRTGTTTQTP